MSEDLKITNISIVNFEQIENLELQPGAVTIISGGNNTGKTSVLNAIRSISDMSHHPAMVRTNAEKAVVKMTLSDGSTITNTIKRSGMEVVVRNSDGKVLPSPKSLVKELFEGMAYDPMTFLRLPKKERAAYLEKLMPMHVERAEILKRVENRALVSKIETLLPYEDYDLTGLAATRKKIYDERAVLNRDSDRLTKTILTLKQSLPDGWSESSDINSELKTALELVENRKDAMAALRDRAADDARSKATDVDQWLTAELDKLRVEAAERKAIVRADLETQRNKIDAEHQPLIDEANTALGKLQQRATDESRMASVARDLDHHTKEAQNCSGEIAVMQGLIEAIDRARAARLKQTPIEGLAVVDGEVIYKKPDEEEPIPYDLHNQQTQMWLALKIAMLGAKRLPIIILDGFESFDASHRAELIEKLSQSDYQVLAGRVVDDGPLTIEKVA